MKKIKIKCIDFCDDMEFEVPEEFIYDVLYEKKIKVEDLILKFQFEYFCSHCGQKIKHIASGTIFSPFEEDKLIDRDYSALLECDCGQWYGSCSPFSGAFYGGKLKYKPWTEGQLERRYEKEKEELEKKIEDLRRKINV